MRGQDRITACFFGDGAVAEGEFHESVNLAALWGLPVLFCCENNQYAMGTPLNHTHARTELADRVASYGVDAHAVDGMDVLAVERAARRAVERIHTGAGPVFLELQTYRYRAHSMYDPDRYRDKAEIEQWRRLDPIDRLIGQLRDGGALTDADLAGLDTAIAAEIEAAVEAAEAAPLEPEDDLTRFVYTVPAGGGS
jgi:pyruvate dehydrogenase E1 component alpha subunit